MGRFAAVGALARLLARPTHHIRWKIILPYAFLVLALAAVGTYLTTRLVSSSLNERFDNQLLEANRVTADTVVRSEREHLETVRAVSFSEGLPAAVQARDTAEINDLVEGIAVNAAVERLEVLDAQGRRLTGLYLADEEKLLYRELTDSDDPADWLLVQRVLDGNVDAVGDKQAEIVETGQGRVLYTAGPIIYNGQRVGAVLAGISLDSLVRRMKSEALADVTIYDFSGASLVSSFVRPDEAASTEANLDVGGSMLRDARSGAGSEREHRTVWGRGYDLVYGRLMIRERPIGLYSVALPTDFIFEAASATRWQMTLLFAIGMIAALAVGLYLARTITEPILRLVRAAELVSEGDFTARTEVSSKDEIGRLAASLNQMTEKLHGQYLATLRALASAVAGRDPNTMGHSLRVGQLAVMLGRHLGVDDKTLAQLQIGGYLHDIGKLGIRDSILFRLSRLRGRERGLIDDHPHISLSVPDPADFQQPVMKFFGLTHQPLDDRGNVRVLSGEHISIVARIVSVADMYDALTLERPYQDPLTPDEALAMLRSQAGRALHFGTVEALASIFPEWERRRGSEAESRGARISDTDSDKALV